MSAGTVPLKQLFSSVRGGAWGTEPGTDDVTLPCVRGTDFDYAHLRVDLSSAPLRGFSRADVAVRAARRDDLIIEKSGGGETQPVGRVALHDHDDLVMPTNFAGRLRPARDVDSRFACYVFASLYAGGRTRAAIKQTTGIQNLDLDALLATRVRCPELPEQRAVADYLDRETARIDALIEKRQRMMALIREGALVRQELLATGRSQKVQMSPSGHDWLGPIPENWSVVRLKHYARIESGHTPSRTRPELWENCTIPWVTLNDVGYLEAHEWVEETVNLISEAGIASSSARVLPGGTVILSRDATVGRCGILARPMATSQHFIDWICGQHLRPRYLWLLFRTAMQTHFASLTDGATLRTIGMPDIGELVVPLPPLDQQDLIVEQAEEVRKRAAKTTELLDKQVSLLQERRRALITAAVTGELEIPEVAA